MRQPYADIMASYECGVCGEGDLPALRIGVRRGHGVFAIDEYLSGRNGPHESESALSQADTLNWIQDIVREELDEDSVVLALDAPFGDVPGWDSLAHVGIIVAIEKRLGRKFAATDIEALETVGDLVDLAGKA